jgi:hypothetical protein
MYNTNHNNKSYYYNSIFFFIKLIIFQIYLKKYLTINYEIHNSHHSFYFHYN